MGEKLLTTGNPDVEHDHALFARLDLHPMQVDADVHAADTVHADILEPRHSDATA
jgi:biotin synthase